MATKNFFVPLLISILTFSSVGWSQTTGSMRGVVIDTEDQPLPGAMVRISSDALIGQTRTTFTNELGVFRFPALPIGAYSVEVTMEGYEPVKVARVDISLQGTAVIPVRMKFATRAEMMTVIGEAPIVDVTHAGLVTSFKNELLKEVPTQRSMTDLMQLSPGIIAGVGDSWIDRTIAFGSNVQSNSWNIDGVDASDPESGSRSGYIFSSINPDLIQEIQVIGVGAPAEYGNHLGAVFNVVTKKGGDEFHGGASYYYQNDSLTGTNVELDTTKLPCGDECSTFNRIKYGDFSSQLGGPIVKDKVWFFGGFNSLRDSRVDPGQNPAFAPTFKSDNYDIKATGRLSEKHEVNGFFHQEDWDFPTDPLSNYQLSALPRDHGSNPTWGGSWTSTLSSNFLLDLNYAGWRSANIHESRTGSFEDPFFVAPFGQFSGGLLLPSDKVSWKNQVRGKATYYAENFLKSEHEFKFGVQYSYGSALTNTAIGPNGIYTYLYKDNQYRVEQDPFQYGGINNDLGFFIDDTVTVNENLTLNLGLRFDHNSAHMQEFDVLTVGQPSISPAGNFAKTGERTSKVDVLNWNIVSPRLGFVFQPGGNGLSKIQGSFGVYYDHNVSGNWDYPSPGFGTLTKYKFNDETGEFDIPYGDPITPEDISINPDLKPPRTLQYSIGYERQIGQSMSLGTQYVYKTTQDLIGWEILGGVYKEVGFTDPYTGNHYTLLSITDNPLFRKGNDPGDFPGSENLDYFQKYHGLIFTFDKKFSNHWSLATSYTWSRSTGLLPRMLFQGQFNPFYSSKEGSDPNNFINAEGRLQGDRPHMFRVLSYFQNLPGGLNVSVNADFSSGKPNVRVIQTNLNQGNVFVIMQRDIRLPPFKVIDLNIGRRFDLYKDTVIRVDGTIFNVLNSDNELWLLTNVVQLPATEFIPSFWTQPRRLQIRLGFEF